jgi:hypothetical protein
LSKHCRAIRFTPPHEQTRQQNGEIHQKGPGQIVANVLHKSNASLINNSAMSVMYDMTKNYGIRWTIISFLIQEQKGSAFVALRRLKVNIEAVRCTIAHCPEICIRSSEKELYYYSMAVRSGANGEGA